MAENYHGERASPARQTHSEQGRLRLFVGTGPGPAVTARMLQVAHDMRESGIDIAIFGDSLAVADESRPCPATIDAKVRGTIRYEAHLDVDDLLSRAPGVVAIVDLAHDSAPGGRHRHLWQDVQDVLAAGRDVLATIDVANLASLKDVVSELTGVPVERSIPDAMFDAAEIQVVDVVESSSDGEDHDEVAGAAAGLRMLTLRRAALAISHRAAALDQRASGATAKAMDRVLVAVSGSNNGEALILAAKRLAIALHAPWHAVHVETPRGERNVVSKRRAADALGLASRLGATISTVPAPDVVEGIAVHLATSPASHLVLGGSFPGGLARLFRGSVLADMLARHRGLSLHVLPQRPDQTDEPATSAAPAEQPHPSAATKYYFYTLAMVGMTVIIAEILRAVAGARGINLLFLFPVIAVAARFGLGPALVAVLASVLCFNFFLLGPEFHLDLAAPQNAVMLVVLGAIAIYTGLLTAQLRSRAALSDRSAQQNARLAIFAQSLARASDWEETARCVCEEVGHQLKVQTAMLREEKGRLRVSASYPVGASWGPIDQAALDWCWQQGQPTGPGTGTLAAGDWRFEPLKTSLGTLAVLGIVREDGREPVRADRAVLFATLVTQAALAHERLKLEDDLKRRDVPPARQAEV